MVPSPSWEVVRVAAAEALTSTAVDKETTLGQFMGKLAERLSVNHDQVKLHKAALKDLIAQKTQEDSSSSSSSDEENQHQDEEEDEDDRSCQDGSNNNAGNDSKGMVALRAMAKAMNLHRYT